MKKNNYSTPSVEMYKVHIPAQAIMVVSNQATTNPLTGETDESTWENLY